MQEHRFTLFADYSQFYLQDEEADGDLSDRWTEQAVKDLLALAPGTIGVGTARNMDVPVIVAVHPARPAFEDAACWDQICEADLNVPSGRIVVAGCTDYFPDAARIVVTPGNYRARIQYGGLDTLSEDGLEGNDHYRIDLWPGEPEGRHVVKRHP
jgi:hypothetical protein